MVVVASLPYTGRSVVVASYEFSPWFCEGVGEAVDVVPPSWCLLAV